jgi:cation diffusion facilitator CzcD-associated flavoprotein CzcO
MDTPVVDVVVVGGGVQGLLILDTLIEAGYSCALVNEGDLGAGQTLHSHGFLNTGFGMSDELPEAAAELVQPYLRARGVTLTGNWTILAPPELPAFASFPPASLPDGFSPAFKDAARALPNHSFNKRQLVEALSRGREEYIYRGSVVGFDGHDPVEAVWVRLEGSGSEVELHA